MSLIDINVGYLLLDLRLGLVAAIYFRGVAVRNGGSWTRNH